LPENAPPPCAPHPPYVSMMICTSRDAIIL
jgi:hypothetical protein